MRDTEHKSIDGGPHPKTWKAGATCDACREYLAQRYLELQTGTVTVIPPIGQSSTNPKMEEFWATGDPSVFDKKEGK